MKTYPLRINKDKRTHRKFKIALKILEKLRQKSKIAYFAGGVVRDLILNQDYKDIDIATDAKPDEVVGMFRKCVLVGKQFGVIRVIYYGIELEITTFRKDIDYIDGRHPDSVDWTDAEGDARRRDFTINALFYDAVSEQVIDYVNGMSDINDRIIRAVGNPKERFNEDKLRILRCLRFSVRLNFKIEKNTFEAIKLFSDRIKEVSFERIRDELKLILTGNNPDTAIRLMSKTNILKEILPEVENLKGVEQPKEFHPEGDVFEHTMLMLTLMEKPTWTLAMGVLLHDIGKPETYTVADRIRFNEHDSAGAVLAEKVCNRLKLSKKEKELIIDLIKMHMKFMSVKKMRISTLKRFLKTVNFNEHLELHRLDCLASHKDISNYYFCKKKMKEFKKDIKIKKINLINGYDLIKIGLKPGPQFKKILDEIEELYLEKKVLNREDALKYIEKYKTEKNILDN